jgi:hypothetical protein
MPLDLFSRGERIPPAKLLPSLPSVAILTLISLLTYSKKETKLTSRKPERRL